MTLGIVLFAVGIFVAVCLHEAGHLVTAKAFGMKATQYFAGFGPTLWSFRRGETEYGVKAIPAGGYVKIVGMTPLETLAPGDEDRAFFRQPAGKRLVVLSAGSITHFLLAFVTLYFLALTFGVPTDRPQLAEVSTCAPAVTTSANPDPACTASDPPSPARLAGLRKGDEVVAFDGRSVSSVDELVSVLRAHPPGWVTVTVRRHSHRLTVPVDLVAVKRPDVINPDRLTTVSAMGFSPGTVREQPGVVGSLAGGGRLLGTLFSGTFTAMEQFPGKLPKLWHAVTGGSRDPNTPVSVVGASRLGGQALAAKEVGIYFGFFAALNVFIGVFNLLPLLPLDGGHIAVLLFEQARSALARLFRRRDPGRVDLAKLMPVTYVVILAFGTLSVLAIVADIVNPIANPFR
jgi:membrane-associated protease RseP (regulator of RpoE activity)